MIILFSEIKLRDDGAGLFIDRIQDPNYSWVHDTVIPIDDDDTGDIIEVLTSEMFARGLEGIRLMGRLD